MVSSYRELLFRAIMMISSLFFSVSILQAQDEFDALRYSQVGIGGTARTWGLGGAAGSMGGDFSSLSVNPAGIGIYRSSEMMMTPDLLISKNANTYLGNEEFDHSSKFNFTNFGLVFCNTGNGRYRLRKGWKSVGIGLGMNRLASFKNESYYAGLNTKNSLSETYAEDFNSLGGLNATTINQVNAAAYGAYSVYLVNPGLGADSNMAVSVVPYSQGIYQTKRVSESGGMSEYLLSAGANYQDHIMIGASMVMVSAHYNRTLQFSEVDASGDVNNNFRYFYFTETLQTTGTGINFKIGAIFKPSNTFRFGLAVHTPNYIQFNDVSSVNLVAHTDSLLLHNNPGESPVHSYNQDSALVFNYSLSTPMKALASATFFLNKAGFFTLDAEYIDYGSMHYNYGPGYENASREINRVIQNTYTGSFNIRAGAEFKIHNTALRLGSAYYGSPYKKGNYGAKTCFTAGVGYRQQHWFTDFAMVYAVLKTQELPYVLLRQQADVPTAYLRNTALNFCWTLGLRF